MNYYSLSVNDPRPGVIDLARTGSLDSAFHWWSAARICSYQGIRCRQGDFIVVFPYWAVVVLAAIWAKTFGAISQRWGDQSRRLREFPVNTQET